MGFDVMKNEMGSDKLYLSDQEDVGGIFLLFFWHCIYTSGFTGY